MQSTLAVPWQSNSQNRFNCKVVFIIVFCIKYTIVSIFPIKGNVNMCTYGRSATQDMFGLYEKLKTTFFKYYA